MKILLADDHDLVRDTLVAYFERDAEFEVVQAHDYPSASVAMKDHGPFALVLLDYGMPGMQGLRGLEKALAEGGGAPVAVISGTADATIATKAMAQGAIGFLPKTMAAKSLVNAVKLMAAGEKFAPVDFMAGGNVPSNPLADKLTKREMQVLTGLSKGLSNKEIARDTDLQEVTIKLHVKTLCRKLDARNRTHAAMIAKDAGIV
ncbi:response regulator [Algirhabdus cladophorae]|uniref:response regulator n=1 Tax=Algirhabdus cladophorae TaxID=3377108 RepID=UPI003B846C87